MINEMIINFVFEGFEDFLVIRININWGIKINEDFKYIFYVWLDVFFNYVSVLGFDLENLSDEYLKYW